MISFVILTACSAEQAEKVTIDGVDFNVQQADITELASTMGELSDEELEHIEQEWKEASSETENHEVGSWFFLSG